MHYSINVVDEIYKKLRREPTLVILIPKVKRTKKTMFVLSCEIAIIVKRQAVIITKHYEIKETHQIGSK